MHKTLSIRRIAAVLKDKMELFPSTAEGTISGIITDSRSISKSRETMFAALRTEVNDGMRYIPELYSQGLRYFMVESILDGNWPGAVFVKVPSVVDALGTLAASMRRPSSTVIVVTGSENKTPVKETLYMGMRRAGIPVFRSPRSFNSYLGICLSVFEDYFDGRAHTLIYEAGIDGSNQGIKVNAILRPDIGIVTDITYEHDENFAGTDAATRHKAKINEKLNLLACCRRIVYNVGDSELDALIRQRFAGTGTELKAVVNATPQELAAAVAPEVTFRATDARDFRTEITAGVRGNVLTIDNFTSDLQSLRYSLERFSRHAAPRRRRVLALGKLSGSTRSVNNVVYRSGRFGISSIIYLGKSAEEGLAAAKSLVDTDVLVFGDNTPGYRAFISNLERADHDTTLSVDLDALVHNFNEYRRMVPSRTGMVAMVKASAYGLGAIEVAKAMQGAGAAYLAVAVVDEGVEMRQAGITMPIMVMNPMTLHYDALFANRLEPAVFSLEELSRIVDAAKEAGITGYPIHIKLDTGMHRVGFTNEQLQALVDCLLAQDAVRVESVFSHLATADCLDRDDYTLAQLENFDRETQWLRQALGHDFKRHILNTAGMMRFPERVPYEMARLGIGLYGLSPLPGRDSRLRTVASLTSVVISLKHWPAGTPIGYGNRGITHRDSIIATVPIGYADGIDRHLGNGATSFIVNGVACPTIGNICMDQCMVDVTDAPGVEIGTHVEIFGRQMPVEKLAQTLDTIPYEILTSVSPRVHRTYFMR